MLKLKSAKTRQGSGSDSLRPDSNIPRQNPWSKGGFAKDRIPHEQFLVTIAGVESKVGATHLALSLAAKASLRNINCAVIISSASFEALKDYYVLSIREQPTEGQKEPRQFASFSGISIMAGVLPGDLEGYQLLIWDCGSLPQGLRRFSSGDLRCLVSGGQAWELAPLSAFLKDLNYEEFAPYALCVRGASDSDFDYLQQQVAGRLAITKILHKPDWTDVTLREDLVTILRLTGY